MKFNSLLHRARIGRFISVGVVGAIIETIIVASLTAVLTVTPIGAKVVGAEASISAMFMINDCWTFADEGDEGRIEFLRRWAKSHLVRAVGLGVAFSVLYILTSIIEFEILITGLDLWPTVANTVGIIAGMSINYIAESIFTWKVAA